MNKNILTIIFLIFFKTSISYSIGNEFGGGFVTQKNGQTWLFDFYEHNITTPHLEEWPDKNHFSNLFKHSDLPLNLKAAVIWKLNEISNQSPEFAQHIAELFNMFRWRFVNLELKRIEDVGPSLIDLKTVVLTPIALRSETSKIIFISKTDFDMLNTPHQIGLLFHEVLGAYYDRSYTEKFWGEDSSRSRKIVAEIFKKNMTFEKLKLSFQATNHQYFKADLTNDYDYKNKYSWSQVQINGKQSISTNDFIYQEKNDLENNLDSCSSFTKETQSAFENFKSSGLDFIKMTFYFYENIKENLPNENILQIPSSEYDPYLKIILPNGHYSHPLEEKSVYFKCLKNNPGCFAAEKFNVDWNNHFDYQKLESFQHEFADRYNKILTEGRNKCDWSHVSNFPNEFFNLRYANQIQINN